MMRLNFANLSDPMQKTGGQVGTASIHGALSRPRLPGSAGDTWGQAPATVIEGQAEKPDLSPVSPNRSRHWGRCKPSIHAAVPTVPVVPAKKHMNEIEREAFEERAGILEDSGMSPFDATRQAALMMGIIPDC